MTQDLGTRIARIEKKLAHIERASRLSAAALDDTALEVRDDAGSLRAIVGQQGDGTTAVNVVNGPVPPAPTTPLVASVIGGVAAAWDGQLVDTAGVPLDFARIEVHAAPTPGFTPGPATLQGTIETAQGATVIIPTQDPLYVRLLTRTTSGAASAPSAENGPIAPALIVAEDVADGIITGTKLSAEALDGRVITGSTLRTAASGQRIVIAPADADGRNSIKLYSGAASELSPAELTTDVNTHPEGGVYPWVYLSAPNTKQGAYSAFISLQTGNSNTQTRGEWEISTGDGNGANTPVSLIAHSANGATPARLILDLAQPGLGSGYADHTITGDSFTWTNVHAKGFSHFSDATTDKFEVSGALHGQHGQFSEEGTWSVPTFNQWKQYTGTDYQTLRASRGAKRARLDGVAMVNTAYSTGSQTAFTLPVGYRPTKAHYFDVPVVASGSPAQVGVRIDSTGAVAVFTSASLSVNQFADFSKVSWPLD